MAENMKNYRKEKHTKKMQIKSKSVSLTNLCLAMKGWQKLLFYFVSYFQKVFTWRHVNILISIQSWCISWGARNLKMNNEWKAPKNAINHLPKANEKLAKRESYRMEKVRNLQGTRPRAETWGINYVTGNVRHTNKRFSYTAREKRKKKTIHESFLLLPFHLKVVRKALEVCFSKWVGNRMQWNEYELWIFNVSMSKKTVSLSLR